jgi:hypothetical protein
VSGRLSRLIAAVIGVSANSAAASSAVCGPAQRRTTRCSTNTAATPSMTCTSAIAHGWKPNTTVPSVWVQNASGGLSTVTTPAGSKPAKKNAEASWDIECTAAA